MIPSRADLSDRVPAARTARRPLAAALTALVVLGLAACAPATSGGI
ncbi:iron ABC transporter substrate-binding protein, partial [Clavibacter michiganensis subsp. michiganensis]|nr:iron ABC transporter substrate-binding protein [Clavibacter michiganensis subsp. michiganensis]